MRIKEFLENVCNEIRYKPIRNDISEELELHIQDVKEEYIASGINELESEEKAVSNMGDAVEIGKKLDKIHRPKLDWLLLILVAILIGFGFLIIFIRATRHQDTYSVNRAIKFVSIGLIASIVVYFMDYRKSIKYTRVFYIVSSLLFVLTILIGSPYNGTHKYIWIPGIFFSTNNICTYLYIISFAGFLNSYSFEKNIVININKMCLKINRDLLKILLLAMISLILSIPVNGVPMTVLLAISYLILSTYKIIKTEKNVRKNLLIIYGAIIAIVVCIALFVLIAKPRLYFRIENWLQNNQEYNSNNGWYGSKIDETLKNSNFIGTGIGEKDVYYFGLFDGGTCHALITIIAYYGRICLWVILATVALIFIKIIINCKNIKDEYGKLLIVGFSSIILLQALVNILGNLNLIPLMDINFPFISYGFNGFLVNMLTIAFLLSIYRRKDILYKIDTESKKMKFKIYFE